MVLTFYYTASDALKADKELTSLGDIEGAVLRDSESILTPVFEVATAALPNGFNYCYCDFTDRFYFCGNSEMVRNGLYRIPCRVDVLSTYRRQLRALTATITRNENLKSGYLLDNGYKAQAYAEIVTKQFPNALTGDSLILITVG